MTIVTHRKFLGPNNRGLVSRTDFMEDVKQFKISLHLHYMQNANFTDRIEERS